MHYTATLSKQFLLTIFYGLLLLPSQAQGQIKYTREEFYSIFSGNSLAQVDSMLNILDNNKETSLNNAYLGALLLKKAGLIKIPAKKLDSAKSGKLLLEKEISTNPTFTEYRFLRLCIQEHAPEIIKYKANLEEDKTMIISEFQKLDKTLKKAIVKYAKTSGFLKPELLHVN